MYWPTFIMIRYSLSSETPTSQFLNILLSISDIKTNCLRLQLPAWRAGRYQIADYAKNLVNLKVLNEEGQPIPFTKEAKNIWSVETKDISSLTIKYDYHCAKMDAGSSWIDEEQIYLNFINCCLEPLECEEKALSIQTNFKDYPDVVCTLPESGPDSYLAEDFQQLADSTFLAAKKLTHSQYKSGSNLFHIWIKGEINFSQEKFLKNFRQFTDKLIADFGEFPEEEYHFIFQLLPFKHYHGVEHRRGTVITYGPASELEKEDSMEDLLGVSCHELYHAWNVCRIRPEEINPYNFGKEAYTKAGWILEGITTYMGDLYLLKSGVYSLETYLKHFSKVLQRESLVQGFQSQSILESSFDLWLDGYEPGVPYRKTSIYTHGALIAFSLDLLLMKEGKSLSGVMEAAWLTFGKPRKGYTLKTFWELLISSVENKEPFNSFYQNFIQGKENIIEFIKGEIQLIGLKVSENPSDDVLRNSLGVILQTEAVSKIHPESPAYKDLMIGDKIKYEELERNLSLEVDRKNGKKYQFLYNKGDRTYFPETSFEFSQETDLFHKWSK